MAQITSAMAAKYLRKLNEEHDALLQKEKKSDAYTVSVQENRKTFARNMTMLLCSSSSGNWKIRFGRSSTQSTSSI